MQRYGEGNEIKNQFGQPIGSGASVTVRVANASCGTGALATIYSSDDSTNPVAGSVVAGDSFGRYNFYAPDGRYDLTYTTPGAAAYNSCNVEIADVTQGSVGSFSGSSDAPWFTARLNNIRFADQFPGATADAQLNACIADVIAAGGGECDARGLSGTQTIAAQVNVGNSSFAPVTLTLPSSASWNVSISDGTSCAIKQFGGTSIVGRNIMTGTNVGTHIIANTGSNMSSLYCTESAPSGGGAYVRAEGFTLDARNVSTMASGTVMLAQKLFDNSKFSDIAVLNYQPNTDALTVYSACCGTKFDNITLNANSTGGRGLFVKADSSASNSSIAFYNLSAGHSNGLPNIEISGLNGAGPTDSTNRNINFYNTYSEFSNTNNSVAVKVQDARGVHFYGLTTGVSGSFTGATGVLISQSAVNQLRDVSISGYRYQAAGGGVGLSNTITGESLLASTGEITSYTYGGQTGSQPNNGLITSDLQQVWKDSAGDSVYNWPVSTNPAPVIKNFVDAIGTFNLDCGLTTAQSCIFQIKQLGSNSWGFGTDSGPNFIVVDRVNGKNIFHFAQSAARATTGVANLLSTESLAWRNNANGADVLLGKTGVASGSLPADSFDISGFGGVKGNGIYQFPEVAAPAGSASNDILYADSTAHRLKMNNNNGGALTVAATSGDTFTTTTLTSPIINGSPTGTGIPTLTLKKGSGGGNYTTASTTYAVVDSTNLCNTVTIPTGWKLHITASGDLGTSTAVVAASYAITDNAACSTANAGVLVEGQTFGNAAGNTEAFSKSWVITGDGAAHNIALQFKTANGADSALLLNSSATLLPTMTFILSPSN